MTNTFVTERKTELTDTDIARFIAGDQAAFHTIYAYSYPFVFRVIFNLVGHDKEEAEDLAHDVYIKIFENRKTVDHTLSFDAWMKRIAINHTLNCLKRRSNWLSKITQVYWHLDMQNISPEPDDDLEDTQVMLEAMLARLTPEDRMILILKELEELPHQEIAHMLNLTLPTVKVRLHRAKKRLVAAYENWQKGGLAHVKS